MGLFKKFFKNNKTNNRNRSVLIELKQHGFSLPRIRKALLDLNDIRLNRLSLRSKVAKSNISMTMRGKRINKAACRAMAAELGLEVDELFPELERRHK